MSHSLRSYLVIGCLAAAALRLTAAESTGLPAWVAEPLSNARQPQVEAAIVRADAALAKPDYKTAAKQYKRVARDARMPANRARALVLQGDSLVGIGEYFDAFEAYRKAMDMYASLIPLEDVAKKEYYLAKDRLALGKRRYTWWPASGNAQAIEVFDHVSTAAPFSVYAPLSLYMAGTVTRWEGDLPDAVDRYKRLISKFPESSLTPHAMVDLGELLLEMADESDGDGTLTAEAKANLNRFLTQYPQHEKRDHAAQLLARANETEARRYLYLARFYQNPVHRQDSASRRYVELILRDYRETASAAPAATLLAELPPAGMAVAELPPAGTAMAAPPTPAAATPPPAAPATPATPVAPIAPAVPETPAAPSATAAPASPSAPSAPVVRGPRGKPNEKWLLPIQDLDLGEKK